MTKMIAFDPGGTTGWSLWFYDALTPLRLIDRGQIRHGNTGFVRFSKSFLADDWVDEVVSESFVDDGRTDFPDVTPLRIEGSIEALWTSEGIDTYMQPNTQKKHGPNALLERHGFYFEGMPHATDSARHAVASMINRRHMPTMRMLKPPRSAAAA